MEVINIRILALDQARNGAWSIFNYDTKQLLASGSFSYPNPKYTYAQAILEIEKLMMGLIEEYKVSAVFLEDIQFRVNAQAFKKLAQLQGVLVNYCEKYEYLYDLIAPTQWQSFCKARSRSTKEMKAQIKELQASGKSSTKILSIQFVKQQFGIDTEDDNLADAICIGWYVVNTKKLKGERI